MNNNFVKKIGEIVTKYKGINVAARASIWFVICSIVQKGISVITLPIFTRLMSTEEFGRYSIYLTWYNILVIIITLNVQSEIFNKGLIEHNREKNAFTANQTGLLIVLGLIWVGIYLPFRAFFNQMLGLTTVLFLVMLVDIVCNAIVSLWTARNRFEYKYIKVVWVTLGMAIMNPVIGIVAVSISNYKAEARVISNAITPVVVACLLIYIIKKQGKLFNHISWWKSVLISSLPLVPHYLSLVLLNQSDKLMINNFVGASYAGIYSVAHSAGLLMTIINSSLNSSFVPWAYNKMKKNDYDGFFSITNSLLIIVMISNLLLIWIAPEAIKILAAPQYAEAVWCVVPIAISVYFYFVYTMFVDVEIYYGGTIFIAIASICAAVLNIILNYIFIPQYGYLAAGYTTLVSYFVTMFMHYIFMKIILKKNQNQHKLFDMKAIFIIAGALVLCAVVAMLLYEYIFIRILIMIVVFGTLFIKRNIFLNVLKNIKNK